MEKRKQPHPAEGISKSSPAADGRREIALLVSGASGGELARRMGMMLVDDAGLETLHLAVTPAARQVLAIELGRAESSGEGLRDAILKSTQSSTKVRVWDDADLTAPIASGSYPLLGTIVLPCSAGMAGAIAGGISRGLVQRAADVALKQRWPLVLGIRETPMSQILLRNLLQLAQAGVHIVPPIPPFYLRPDPAQAMEKYLEHYCVRVLDLLGISVEGRGLRWRR